MRIIDHRQFQKPHVARWRRPVLYGVAGVVGVFVLVNIVMAVAYRGRVLPRYTLSGVAVGNVSFGALQRRLDGRLLASPITLRKDSVSRVQSAASLGAAVDITGSIADLKASRPLLPVLSLLTRHEVPARITIDAKQYQVTADQLSPSFTKSPLMRRVVFNGTQFTIAEPENGYRLDTNGLRRDVLQGLGHGQTSFTVATTTLTPATASTDLNAEVQKLQPKLALKTIFVYNGKTIQPSVKDIGGWYEADFNSMKPSPDKIGAYLDSITPAAANRSDLVLAIQYALGRDLASNLAVVPKGALTRTYCTAVRGASTADLEELASKLALTYADIRGWNNGGRMAFQHVQSNCEYTVWLSAASQMASFGAICDDYYNCQVGTNVVVNEDRWQQATPPWNATGGTVENYRTLIINHETGHRLGFYDNPTCPAAGQPAPVMMQQSIDLKGCTFNVWPLSAELHTLAANLGLPAQGASD